MGSHVSAQQLSLWVHKQVSGVGAAEEKEESETNLETAKKLVPVHNCICP